MSERFTASNGLVVVCEGEDSVRVENPDDPFGPVAGKGVVASLREFFLHERDQELGRWRSTLHPDWTAAVDLGVCHFRKDDGIHAFEVDLDARNYSGWALDLREVANEYLVAHPLPKPAWHDAQARELWEVSVSPTSPDGIPAREPLPMQVMLDDSGPHETLFFAHWNGPDVETIDVEDRHIESAKRLWPEVVES